MKKLKLILVLTAAVISITSGNLRSQQWHWEWANTSAKNGHDAFNDAIHSDFLNYIYCRTAYDSALYFPDTSFHHPEQLSMNANYAISRYDMRGNFIDALDLYTLPGNNIQYVWLVTDSLMNIYLCAPFTRRVFINDTLISIAITPWPDSPDVFLAKLSPDYEFIWSGLISSDLQDDLRGMVISEDNYLYIACEHMGGGSSVQVDYLNQDSTFFTQVMSSIIKTDLEGNLIWHKEIRSEYGADGRELFIGENGLIYFVGYSYGDIIVGGDTIHHPYLPAVQSARYLVVFDPSGAYADGYFFDWDINVSDVKANETGDIYVSGSIYDTAVIGTDTVIVPEGDYYGIVGRFTSQLNPIWYQTAEGSSFSSIFLDNDNLIFNTSAEGTIHIADTIFNVGNYAQILTGEFDSEGHLVNFITSQCSRDMYSIFKVADNCRNPVIGGGFMGSAIFGDDTITSHSNSIYDGFVAKLMRNEPATFSLGTDTATCNEYTITGPSGYQYYFWNDSITSSNLYSVTETENFIVGCANAHGCWSYDTIHITIQPGFEIDLGPDTTILENQNFVLTVPDIYESFLWSNTVTANSITVFGESYDPGTILPVWVRVTDGLCIISDTVYVTIKSEFGVDELVNNRIKVYPNPFHDEITIDLMPDVEQIEILDLNGMAVYELDMDQSINTSRQVKIENLPGGIYILKVKSREQNLIQKIVKL